jgi:peptidylprolyl isomerase
MSITRPEIDFPGGEPPAELQVTDIWEGDGGVAQPGDLVRVHYVGGRVLHRGGIRRQLE